MTEKASKVSGPIVALHGENMTHYLMTVTDMYCTDLSVASHISFTSNQLKHIY